MEATERTPNFKQWSSTGLLLALVGGAVTGGLATSLGSKTVLTSYLYAYTFWLALSLGCLGLLTLHHAIRGSWSLSTIRIFESGGGPRMMMALIVGFIPIFLGRHTIYHHWMHHEGVDKVLDAKAWWLNEPFWMVRIAIYFGLWILLGHVLVSSSRKEDQTLDRKLGQQRSSRGAFGLVVFMLSCTFAMTDWLMSIDPHWSSTIFGLWTVISGALTALAISTIIVTTGAINKVAPYSGIWTPKLGKDLGNMLFAFSMLWAYTSLSQFLIIWSGNLPEFITYYYYRQKDFWNALGGLNIFVGFFMCWGVLLAPRVKASPRSLRNVACVILLVRATDWLWIVVPFLRGTLAVTEITAMVAMGGLWFFVMGREMTQAAILPEHDTRLVEMAKMEAAHA